MPTTSGVEFSAVLYHKRINAVKKSSNYSKVVLFLLKWPALRHCVAATLLSNEDARLYFQLSLA